MVDTRMAQLRMLIETYEQACKKGSAQEGLNEIEKEAVVTLEELLGAIRYSIDVSDESKVEYTTYNDGPLNKDE